MIQIAQLPQDEAEVFILSLGFPILTIHPERSVLVGRHSALVFGASLRQEVGLESADGRTVREGVDVD